MLQRAHYSKSIVIFCSLFDPACQGFLCNVWLLLLLFVAWLVGFFFKSRPIRSDLKIAKKYIILCKTLHSVDQHSSQLLNVAHKHFVNYTTHSSIIRTLCGFGYCLTVVLYTLVHLFQKILLAMLVHCNQNSLSNIEGLKTSHLFQRLDMCPDMWDTEYMLFCYISNDV